MLQLLEPRTDVPAKEDWSTRLAFADVLISTRHSVETIIVTGTFVATFFLPGSPGNTAARIVLGVLMVMSLGGFLPNRHLRRAVRLGVFDEPWRRVAAAVAEKREDDPRDRLLADGLVLVGSLGDLPDRVAERQEVFVLGPDGDGLVLLRAAGSTSMYVAAPVDESGHRAAERVERVLGRPADERELEDGVDMMRVLRHLFWGLPVLMVVVAGVLLALSVSPPAPAGLIAVAVLVPQLFFLPTAIELFLHNDVNARAVNGSDEWTPVPVRLFAWQRGHHVAGIAELPGGPALVRFPRPNSDLVANIAGTGVMWVAGTYRGRLAVGLPGAGALMTAVVRPVAASDPMASWRRIGQVDFSALPR
ncbi:hypothetical protein GCM10011609_29620 [Lentzea pudingi]|uniref:Uncharacterized protein n=1 Tax=Lentzea pudingi TaxID=1789439 RepID=A0ABQ2HV11_9PSEU|nr:hypothetical protein [Lentzea pudingi]GGM90650.1 hypothetical protein GCM10011609_29620 [Lentzea pudingi]